MADAFTRNLADLLDQNQKSKERLSAYDNPQKGQGEKSEENGVGEEAKTAAGKEAIVRGRYINRERLSTICEPINPAPPVTRYFI